jgi:hypothetical protein
MSLLLEGENLATYPRLEGEAPVKGGQRNFDQGSCPSNPSVCYGLGCFDITKEMCNQISAMIVKYWWTNQDKEKCMLSWEKLVKPKAEGGLGFRDLHSFNMAMLAKQGWRILHNPNLHSFNMAMLAKQGWRIQHNPNTLCAQILEAKYFPNTSLLQAKMRDGCSYTWRSIFQGKRA